MVQAFILIQTEVGQAAAVAQAITELPGVTSAEDVTGPYDVIVRAEAQTVDELGKLVVARIQGVGDHPDPHLPGGAPLTATASGAPPRDGPPRWRVIAAIGVAVAAVVVVIVLAAVVNSRPVGSVDDPLAVSAAEAPGAGTPACAALAAALPDQLGGLPRRTIEHGDDPSLTGVAAWGNRR